MWTKNSHWLIFHLRIGAFGVPLAILPFRCLDEVIEGVMDIVSLFRPFPKKVLSVVTMLQVFFAELRAYGKLDLVKVKAYDEKGPVRISIMLR